MRSSGSWYIWWRSLAALLPPSSPSSSLFHWFMVDIGPPISLNERQENEKVSPLSLPHFLSLDHKSPTPMPLFSLHLQLVPSYSLLKTHIQHIYERAHSYTLFRVINQYTMCPFSFAPDTLQTSIWCIFAISWMLLSKACYDQHFIHLSNTERPRDNKTPKPAWVFLLFFVLFNLKSLESIITNWHSFKALSFISDIETVGINEDFGQIHVEMELQQTVRQNRNEGKLQWCLYTERWHVMCKRSVIRCGYRCGYSMCLSRGRYKEQTTKCG